MNLGEVHTQVTKVSSSKQPCVLYVSITTIIINVEGMYVSSAAAVTTTTLETWTWKVARTIKAKNQ